MNRMLLCAIALGSCVGGVANAADGVADARACVEVADDGARLACYDRALGRAATAATAAVGATAIARDTKAEFGLSDAEKLERAGRTEPGSVTLTVQSVTRRETGQQVFTMADGQVWVEVEGYTRARVAPGQSVTVRKGAIGSYLLVTPQQVGTKVRRVK